jgi:hypothetical protein
MRAAVQASGSVGLCPTEDSERMGGHYNLEGRLRNVMSLDQRRLGFHDLRRSHASLLAEAGVSTAITRS